MDEMGCSHEDLPFSSKPCPEAWRQSHKSLRVILPSPQLRPALDGRDYHHRLDEWLLADELGLDIMINEHHATATVAAVARGALAILARANEATGAASSRSLSDRQPPRTRARRRGVRA